MDTLLRPSAFMTTIYVEAFRLMTIGCGEMKMFKNG